MNFSFNVNDYQFKYIKIIFQINNNYYLIFYKSIK